MSRDGLVPWLALLFLTLTAIVLWPFAIAVLFAIWASAMMRPAHTWLANKLGRRPRVAALVATLALVSVATPAIVLAVSLADDAVELVRRALATDRVQNLLHSMAGPEGGTDGMAKVAVSEGGRAWQLLQQVAGTAARVVIGLVIAIGGLYGLLVDGGRWYAWLEDHAPMSRTSFRRLAGAVVETGRGLVFGILGAGLAQAVVATILYIVLGVPQPLALGLLTLACSVVPAIGTSIVWMPITVALAWSGQTTQAFILAAGGLLVIGTIDNLVRPYLARKGRLQLPTFIVALAMFGGIAALGTRGLLLGPLVVRVTKELLMMWRGLDER